MKVIYSIVVLYNPEEDSVGNITQIMQLSSKTFVIVNSCSDEILGELNKLDVNIIVNPENIGLSKALNIGIKECLKNTECDFITLFDQDSMPGANFFDILSRPFADSTDKIAAIGPLIDDVKNNKSRVADNNHVKDIEVIISSGCLIPVSVINEVGMMDETLFIDYIDYEWCLRAKSKGYKILQNTNAALYHNMGDAFVSFLGVAKPIHKNKIRHYYIIRNQLIMLNRDYISFKWKIVHTVKLLYRIPAYLIFSDDRVATLKMMIKAIKDFVVHRKEYKTIKY